MKRMWLVGLLIGLLVITACGGTSSQSGRATVPGAAAPDVAATGAADEDAADAGAAANPEVGEICLDIPSLAEISTLLGAEVVSATDNSKPTVEVGGQTVIEQRCDVTGSDGISNVVFERWDSVSGETTLAAVQAQGLVYQQTYPELPGGVAWGNGLTIEHQGYYYVAYATTLKSVGVLDSPDAYDRSAALLSAWIN